MGGSGGHGPDPGAPDGGNATPGDAAALAAVLPDLMIRDERRLRRRLDQLSGSRAPRRGRGARTDGRKDDAGSPAALARLADDVAAAQRRIERRRAAVPVVRYPPELPVSAAREDILAAIRDSQVVVVAGETGSGKTTQLPKMCLDLGRGIRGAIGHTQPRRLAARAVADRIAEELGTHIGAAVGYKVRFTDKVGESSLVKLMTDGILLAEIQHDPLLLQYDTLILDEAHERSLNIDFLLGYLKQLLPRRPDLKLIITSATIDPQRFAEHFGGAPVVEVSGRTYPVEVRYRPLVDDSAADEEEDLPDEDAARRRPPKAVADRDSERDSITAICDAVEELWLEGAYAPGVGDILVFLSGEREIRDTADALRRLQLRDGGRDVEVLPLYARLSATEQHRVFQRSPGRRVVLATNVAETSLTVPGIRYVVDPGTARISRYSSRLKVQRLPIERISQASANQRKGRCGRVAEGICIRLYNEEDFAARPEFTDPEILRTNLASVILQMTALGLGDIAAFPFLEPPDRRHIRDGIQLLEELGALEPATTGRAERRLTPLGRRLAQLPVDPRFARMVLEADRNGCVREVLVIAAALSIQDPRERPSDKQQAADEKHARFADPTSDFAAYLNLWRYLHDKQDELSSSAFRRLCKAEFLHYLRVREWQDLHGQLEQVVRGMDIAPNSTEPAPAQVTTALLAGLLSHLGMHDPAKRDYLGARGARFAIFPGSALAKKPPRWVMAAELVETSRLWGRVCARIEPEAVEPLAGHLVKRSYSEPHWEKKRGSVVAYEKVTLYGLLLVARRAVPYGSIDPGLSRELFVRHALVEGDWDTHHRFLADNRALLADAEELEHRARRRDLVVDDDALYDFYDARVPADVVSGAHFDRWWKGARRDRPGLLTFDPAMLLKEPAAGLRADDYPDVWRQGDLELPLSYQFEPGADADGVTVHLPLAVLNRVTPDGFDWLIPGLREELVVALLRALPKEQRRLLVPVPDTARDVLPRLAPYAGREPLLEALGHELYTLRGVDVRPEDWQLERVPDHLRMTFQVEDERGRALAEGKDLEELQRRLRATVQATVARAASSIERSGLTAWPGGELARTFADDRAGVRGFPALVDEGDSVAVRVLPTLADQSAAMWRGTRRLLRLTLPSPLRSVAAGLSTADKLALAAAPHGGIAPALEDCLDAALDELMGRFGGLAWDEASFARLRDAVRSELDPTVRTALPPLVRVLTAAREVERRLDATTSPALAVATADLRAQLAGLVFPGFVTATGLRRLPDLLRYLRAMERRLEVLPTNAGRDAQLLEQVSWLRGEYEALLASLPEARRTDDDVRAIRWMLEELRVSLFAQTVGTPQPVSEKRILKAMDAVAA